MDWIPDDVLIHILSRLPLKEAARTSLLSRRWRHLWTHTTSLDLEYPQMPFEPPFTLEFWPDGRDGERLQVQYMDMVDQVIAASQAPALDCFRVRFFFEDSQKVDSWVNFAMSRKARDLELNFGPPRREPYRFPGPSSYTSGFVGALKSLRLVRVNIAPEDVTFLLAKCVLLEELDIRDSWVLTHFEIAPGPPLRLKRLVLGERCLTITIAAPTPDLASLEFSRVRPPPVKILHIQYAPKLTDLHVISTVDPSLHLISFLSQIQTLSLTLSRTCWREVIRAMPLLPDMTCLKHLTLGVGYLFNPKLCPISLYDMISSMVTISRSLQHLTVKITSLENEQLPRRRRTFFRKGCHPSLRVMELRGFEGSDDTMELALYLLRIADSPEKLILDLRGPFMDKYNAYPDPRKLGGVLNRALELRGSMPRQVHLIVRSGDGHAASCIKQVEYVHPQW